MEKNLLKRFNYLKNKLTLTFYEKQSLTNPEVVAISQELDVVIIQLQKMNRELLQA